MWQLFHIYWGDLTMQVGDLTMKRDVISPFHIYWDDLVPGMEFDDLVPGMKLRSSEDIKTFHICWDVPTLGDIIKKLNDLRVASSRRRCVRSLRLELPTGSEIRLFRFRK